MLYCNNCYWSGLDFELVTLTDDLDDNDFSYCPDCEGNDFYEEDDDEAD